MAISELIEHIACAFALHPIINKTYPHRIFSMPFVSCSLGLLLFIAANMKLSRRVSIFLPLVDECIR